MKTKFLKLSIFVLALAFSGRGLAQDEESPFEDFPDLESSEDSASSATEEAQKNSNMAEAQEEVSEAEEELGESASNLEAKADTKSDTSEEEALSDDALEEEFDQMADTKEAKSDSESESSSAQTENLDEEDQMEVVSPAVKQPVAPSPLLAQPTNLEDSNSDGSGLMEDPMAMPDDIQALEKRLEQAEQLQAGSLGSDLSDEPGNQLPPSDKFWRVPLRPQMSDANWVRWAGPMVDKEYNVHRGDSLWKVSERLFGTPFLWPKIWHLNASITNPHIISTGMTLDFKPGNPGSAPELAYKSDISDASNVALYPLTKMDKEKTLLEFIDATLRMQIQAPHPPFQYFLLYSKPDSVGEIPKIFNSSGKIFYREGDSFKTSLADGIFPIVKIKTINIDFSTYYRVNWLGTLKVEGNRATVVKAFREVQAGDLIVNRSFRITPLAIHEETIGPEEREQTRLVPLQEGAEVHTAEYGLMGIRFPSIGVGPRPGALITINVGNSAKAKALLIDRDQRTGTLWIVNSEEEVDVEDSIF